MLGVDEVLRGGRMGYYIGLIKAYLANKANKVFGRLMVNRSFKTNVTNIL